MLAAIVLGFLTMGGAAQNSAANTAPQTPATTPAEPVPAGQATTRFVRWIEPKEHSFSVEVPQGWQVIGSVNWTGPTDAQQFLRLQSPDSKVVVFLGDPELLPRTVPNQMYALTGAVEGRVIQAPGGGRTLMQRFLTGNQYAKEHTVWRLCPNPRWVKDAGLPDLSRNITAAVQPEARAWGATATASAGEVSFTCDTKQGYVFAATVLGSSPKGPIQGWGIYRLWGFLSSDPGQSMRARYIMERMAATFATDPAWQQAYDKRVRDITGMVISMQNAAAQAQRSAAQSASDTLSRLNHPNQGVNVRPGSSQSSSVNTILGTKDVCDAIGRCKNVSNDSDTYYIDHSGNFRAGTASGGPPDNTGVWSPAYTQ
jgi:hypothetical protein